MPFTMVGAKAIIAWATPHVALPGAVASTVARPDDEANAVGGGVGKQGDQRRRREVVSVGAPCWVQPLLACS
jgi:hypothetical protein